MKHTKPGLVAAGNHPTIIGRRVDGRPIYLISGGNGGVSVVPDDDETERALFGGGDDDDPDEDPDDEDDPGEDEDPGYVPPAREVWEKMQSDLRAQRAANSHGGRLARALRDAGLPLDEAYAKLGLDPKTGQPVEPAEEPEVPEVPADTPPADVKKLVEEAVAKTVAREVERAVAKTEERLKGPLIAMSVKSALHDAKWSGKDLARVLRLIDANDIEVTDDGDILGVVEQVEAIKEDFPEWFKGEDTPTPTVRRPRGAADVGGGGGTPPRRERTWKEKAMDRIDGKR